MKPADRIPLESIAEKHSLCVPNKLSRETASRLMKRGWIRWLWREETRRSPKGTVQLTPAGRAALAGAN